MIVKIAKVLDVSVDYLIGYRKFAQYDKDIIKRIEDIQLLDSDTKKKLFFLIDNIVQNFKTKQAFAVLGKLAHISQDNSTDDSKMNIDHSVFFSERKTYGKVIIRPMFILQ